MTAVSKLPLSQEAIFILKTLKKAGFEGYIVGGAVRDLLLASKSSASDELQTDYDFATNATPEEIGKTFPESFYENDFGTVTITAEHLWEQMGIAAPSPRAARRTTTKKKRIIDLARATKLHQSLKRPKQAPRSKDSLTQTYPDYEITTYRSKELYENFRHPTKLEWGKSIKEDLERRDFTINSMALTLDHEVIDPYSGQRDLKQGLIRCVNDPNIRFKEDALRMLRAIRLSVQLNMKIEEKTLASISTNASLIKHISWERISDEFLKMISSDYPAEAIELLDQTGLLDHILPELKKTKGVKQGGHHTTDVWVHSLDALRECPSADPVVRLATLLHDISKPQTQEMKGDKITFYNHEIIGSRTASKIAKRLKLSKVNIQRIFILVRYHMFHYQSFNKDASIRRFMRKVGLENIDDILDLREGDRLGSGARKTSWRLEEMKKRMIEQLHQPMEISDMAVDGDVLMKELKLKPGPVLGELLKALFEKVLDNPELNEKEKLLIEAKKLIKTT